MNQHPAHEVIARNLANQTESGKDTVVLIATYNEIDNLPTLISEIFCELPAVDVLVVDDASPDGTGDWVATQQVNEPRLHLLRRAGKLGLGSAMIDGMRWCLDRDYYLVANMDGDLSHPPRYLPALVSRLRDDDSVDVVIASRYAPGGQITGWPRHRRLMSRLINSFARSWFALPSRDCSGSFRCYRVSALRKMGIDHIVSPGYAFYEEVLWRLRIAGAKMVEVPYTFRDRTKGKTKLNLRESLRSIGTLITLRWR